MSELPNFLIDWDCSNESETQQVIFNVTEMDSKNFLSEFNIDPSFFEEDMDMPASNVVIEKTEVQIPVATELKDIVKGFVEIKLEDIDKYNAQHKNKNTAREHNSNQKKLKKNTTGTITHRNNKN